MKIFAILCATKCLDNWECWRSNDYLVESDHFQDLRKETCMGVTFLTEKTRLTMNTSDIWSLSKGFSMAKANKLVLQNQIHLRLMLFPLSSQGTLLVKNCLSMENWFPDKHTDFTWFVHILIKTMSKMKKNLTNL